MLPTEEVLMTCLTQENAIIENEECSLPPFALDCTLEMHNEMTLSDKAKALFVDFCIPLDETLRFVNEGSDTINCEIIEKEYIIGPVHHIFGINSPDCQVNCARGERSMIHLKCNQFDISLHLNVQLDLNVVFGAQNEYNTNFRVDSYLSSTSSLGKIFSMKLDNLTGEIDEQFTALNPDRVTKHASIELNGKHFEDVISNEDYLPQNPAFENIERIYISERVGLVAVRDSLGVLWRKV